MKRSLRWAPLLAVPALLLTACGGGNSSSATPTNTSTSTETAAAVGTQPDVNGDGKVVIGVMSPGDTNDHGYYQSFVDDANSFAQENGWTVITVDKINLADGLTQARNLCRQSVDLIAIGASELKDALGATTDPSCANVHWYMNGGVGVEQTKYFAQSTDKVKEVMFAAGYASGLLLKEAGQKAAGFVAGPEVDFIVQAADGFRAGLLQVLPDAKLQVTYTGDHNDSAKAKEAANAQIANGVKVIYPYLGGATDAVAGLAAERGVMTLTPGTDRCADPTTKFDVSVIFSPGAYFAAALQEFKGNSLTMGETRVWNIGKDPVPTVKLCDAHTALQSQVDQLQSDIAAGKFDVEKLVTEAAAKA